MLSYRGEPWILLHGPSRFEACITAGMRRPEDVMWSLELSYVAGGARWRRVQQHERPEVDLSVNSWELPSGRWKDLEGIKNWGGKEEREMGTGLPWLLTHTGGWLDLCERREPGQAHEISTGQRVEWQVREREGARFLVELAAGISGVPPAQEEARVLADGTVEEAERDPADWWKENAAIYAVEWAPFGQVTVRVPRNAKDLVGYAQRRARELLGVSTPPEAYQIHDYLEMKQGAETEPSCGLRDDVFVRLHFHGFYEDA